MKQSKLSIKDLTIIAVFSATIAICAWITIPFQLIPFTLQTFAVFLILSVLGGKKGLISIAVYILLGMVGVPVFSGFKGGLAALMGPTGGYIWGFLLQALVFILFEKYAKKIKFYQVYALILGALLCYAAGTVWFVFVYSANVKAISLFSAYMICVNPYLIIDAIKLVLALLISKRLKKALHI